MPKRRSRKRSPSARLNPTPPPAEAAGSTTTSSESAAPAVEPGSPAELADVAQQVREELKPEQPAVEVHDRRTEGGPSAAAGGTIADELVDVAAEKLEDLEKPGQFERLVAQLTEEDLGDVIELGFGWVADTRGPHWEIGEKQSRRLAHWLKKSLQRHPQLLTWLGEWLPDVVCGLLLSYEIWARVRIDQQLAEKKRKEGSPDGGSRDAGADAEAA